jgi:ABC-type Mn2+/Zn2+ transport system ATPase subunit
MQLNTVIPSETNGFVIGTNGTGKPTQIKALHTGVYNIQFSAQLGRIGNKNNDMYAEIWLAYDGQPIENSNTKIYITGNQSPDAKVVASWNFLATIQAGHNVQLMWSVSDVDFVITSLTKTGETPHLTGPDVPSLIVTVSQVG